MVYTNDRFSKVKQYCIIGAITKYAPDDVTAFVNSINKTGFTGGRYMITYDVPSETITYLKESGFEVVEKDKLPTDLDGKHHVWGTEEWGEYSNPIVVYRFKHLHQLLTSDNFIYDRAIVVDVKDTIFQSDPSVWMEKNQTHPILVGSESILVKDMAWSSVNYRLSFPHLYNTVKNKLSYCAGVIAGDTSEISRLFIEIFNLSIKTNHEAEPPDQAAMNMLIETDQFNTITQRVTHTDGWVTHLGVSLSDPKQYTKNLQDKPPIIKDGKIYNHNGELFSIIHQYDRLKDFTYKP